MALKSITLALPGSYGLNSQDEIAADEAMRYASTLSNAVIDKTGKVVCRENFVIQSSSGVSAKVLYRHPLNDGTELMFSAFAGQVYSGGSSSGETMTVRFDYRAGSQIVDVGGAKAGATATGLANDTTSYTFTIAADGGAAATVSFLGNVAQTYTTLLSRMGSGATAFTVSLVGGNLKFVSATNGTSSSILLAAGGGGTNPFPVLTSFRAVRNATAGTATNENWQFASLNQKLFMAQTSQHFTCLNETSYAVESIVAQPWGGTPNCVLAADGRLWVADDGAATVGGYQEVDVGSNKSLASATSLVAATTYTASVVIDGGASQSISIVGSSALTFGTLITELNLDMVGAHAVMEAGNLRIRSDSGGVLSTVAITAGTLFASPLAGFVAVNSAVAGAATGGGNRYTVWWSDLLNGKSWDGGDAGSLDVRGVWPSGQDTIVAIAMLSGRLLIFGRNNILLYTLPADRNPASMSLTDAVSNIGCIARDSVIVANGDLYFLAADGIYKIPKLAQVTGLLAPMRISKLIADDVIDTYASETLAQVRAGYYPKENLLVFNAPTANKTFVFHLSRPIPDMDTVASATWTNTGMPFRGFAFDKDQNWYAAGTLGIYKYTGYGGNSGSNAYTFDFYSQWLGMSPGGNLQHLKSAQLTLKAVSGATGTFNWQTDFIAGTTNTASFTADAVEFAEDPGVGTVHVQLGRSCVNGKFGFTMTPTAKISLHQLKLFSSGGAVKMR